MMRLVQTVKLGAWFLILANVMMSFGAIWILNRMAPAIEMIIVRNERSLQACEEMLAALALPGNDSVSNKFVNEMFTSALLRAEGNITEKEEPEAISAIRHTISDAFSGNAEARKQAVTAIMQLSRINRDAMTAADARARQFGSSGAWTVVFMASGVFLFGMLFLGRLEKDVVKPFEEIHSVVTAFLSGNILRRCSGHSLSNATKIVYRDLNELLDSVGGRSFHKG